jgi:hypothetical protein
VSDGKGTMISFIFIASMKMIALERGRMMAEIDRNVSEMCIVSSIVFAKQGILSLLCLEL